ncbi:MAG: SAM-dependent methyltransferase [Gammaproteobacteria bacterium]|nr:SAM-dependent methyltransferase [Gammaproteobacteria bacterium]
MSPVRPPESLLQLPTPDAEAQAHSERLISLITDEIAAAGGGISFARYMELALFAPGLGYYSAGASKFGEQGDFVTAPEISPLFSRALAQQVAEVLTALEPTGKATGSGEVLEVGGGTGCMAADMLAELETLGVLPARYSILELSADLQARQHQTLSERVPHLLPRVQWLNALPASGFRGVVVANELLDALPVHCFRVHKRGMGEAGLRERWVGFEQGRFQWRSDDLAPAPVLQQQLPLALLDQLSGLPDGYESEVNLAAGAWVEALAERLAAGVVLLIDYGFPRHEYYHPQRSRGTLMCHYRHRAHDDPFVYPGLQDITAHVDFTAIAEAAVAAGLEVRGYNTQGLFLLGCGLAELAQRSEDPTAEHNERQQILQAQQIRRLTLPGEMGERFKVIALSRNYDHPLRGFALQDLRHQL